MFAVCWNEVLLFVIAVVERGPHHCRRSPHGCAKVLEEAKCAPLEDVVTHDEVHRVDDGVNWKVFANLRCQLVQPLSDYLAGMIWFDVGVHRVGVRRADSSIWREA